MATNPKLLHAEFYASKHLGDYNARVEAGKDDARAAAIYRKAQFWLDRYNKLAGNS